MKHQLEVSRKLSPCTKSDNWSSLSKTSKSKSFSKIQVQKFPSLHWNISSQREWVLTGNQWDRDEYSSQVENIQRLMILVPCFAVTSGIWSLPGLGIKNASSQRPAQTDKSKGPWQEHHTSQTWTHLASLFSGDCLALSQGILAVSSGNTASWPSPKKAAPRQ